jgi:hypothetical protein
VVHVEEDVKEIAPEQLSLTGAAAFNNVAKCTKRKVIMKVRAVEMDFMDGFGF